MPGIEEIVVSKLIFDDTYCRKVIPFIKDEYFDQISHQVIFREVRSFIDEYDTLPEPNAIALEVENKRDLSEEMVKRVLEILQGLDTLQPKE